MFYMIVREPRCTCPSRICARIPDNSAKGLVARGRIGRIRRRMKSPGPSFSPQVPFLLSLLLPEPRVCSVYTLPLRINFQP